jgi:hypothetical protein
MLRTVGVLVVLKKGKNCDSKMGRMKNSITDGGAGISLLLQILQCQTPQMKNPTSLYKGHTKQNTEA